MLEYEIIEAGGKSFAIRPNTSDKGAIKYGFLTPEAERPKIGFRVEPGELWLDMGGYIGTFAIMALSRKAKVIIFEPFLDHVNIIQKNLELNNLKAEIISKAVVNKTSGKESFVINNRGGRYDGSGLFNRWKTERPWITVDSIKFSDALEIGYQTQHPLCIKMNIEGAEIEILENWKPEYDVKKFVFEWHFQVENNLNRLRNIIFKIENYGYTIISHGKIPQDRDTWYTGKYQCMWFHCTRNGKD